MKKFFLLSILIIMIISVIYSSGLFKKNPHLIKVEGEISLVGNEPFTDLVIKSDKTYYYLPNDLKKNYTEYLGFKVEAEGELQQKVMESADHKYKVTKNILTNVKIRKISRL